MAQRYSDAAIVDDVLNRAKFRFGRSCLPVTMPPLLFVFLQEPAHAAGSRSTYIPYDASFGLPDFRTVSLDQACRKHSWSRQCNAWTADGKYELAASLLEPAGDRFERSSSVANGKRLVYLKLMEKHQNTDPFKFIIYSGTNAADECDQVKSGAASAHRGSSASRNLSLLRPFSLLRAAHLL
jgi:hypothetical protein